MSYKAFIVIISSFLLSINYAQADWLLNPENSKIAFGSIKKNSIGESNYFQKIKGQITEAGKITLLIDLSSVETWVDIRNDRIREFLFQTGQFPAATLTGQIDMGQLKNMAVGSQQPIDVAFELDFHGHQQPISAELIIMRLSEKTVVVIADEFIFLDAEKFDLLPGLETLQKLAKLPSISSAVPVTFHLTFNQTP